MQLQPAQRKNVKIKLGIQGPSGSGKTMSALLLAVGLTQDWTQVAVIDTENHSAELYAHLGTYFVLPLTPPYTPERYIEAIQVCVRGGIKCIVLDGISSEWETILDAHSQLTGNSYTNWSKFTPRHQHFLNALLQTDVHIICTLRSKQDYILVEKNGKQVPEKVGMKPIQRDGIDYELTLVFELTMKNHAVATKDRTGLFTGQPEFIITSDTGKLILDWCNQGISQEQELRNQILQCKDVSSLRTLYEQHPLYQKSLLTEFNLRKHQLQSQNGQHTH
ncbi:AAA family ATPase [Telluribacter humicola]|uniref:AAA family ATPase n=1 Tax=Telluribacter humicola TaxID=1720261 RepID=UPI001A97606A|nr:AAA family ATPase [Telluribacter humicola]